MPSLSAHEVAVNRANRIVIEKHVLTYAGKALRIIFNEQSNPVDKIGSLLSPWGDAFKSSQEGPKEFAAFVGAFEAFLLLNEGSIQTLSDKMLELFRLEDVHFALRAQVFVPALVGFLGFADLTKVEQKDAGLERTLGRLLASGLMAAGRMKKECIRIASNDPAVAEYDKLIYSYLSAPSRGADKLVIQRAANVRAMEVLSPILEQQLDEVPQSSAAMYLVRKTFHQMLGMQPMSQQAKLLAGFLRTAVSE